MNTPHIAIVHNAYRHKGGEDSVVENEVQALQRAGCRVDTFRPETPRGPKALLSSVAAPFGKGVQGDLERWLANSGAQILHVHNLYPLLSAKVFAVAQRLQMKTVQTFHNFRPLCLNGLFLTPQGEICERCPTQSSYHPGIVRGCYRESRLQSAALAGVLVGAKRNRWYDAVDRFIAPSQFLRDRYVHYGWSESKIEVQPHFLPEFSSAPQDTPENYVVYLGRLSEEKGVRWLVETFMKAQPEIPLCLAGDGPLRAWVERRTSERIRYLGRVVGQTKQDLLRRAAALVLPSECYENFPMAVIEANAEGTPALVASLGGMKELAHKGSNMSYLPRSMDSFVSSLRALHPRQQSLASRQNRASVTRAQFSRDQFLTHRLKLYRDLIGTLSTTPTFGKI